jgi:murein L,D-transpeptidase YafK
VAGPKLKEGDKQVPEGFYKNCWLSPNLVAHIGMDINYPNDRDRRHAKAEKRRNLGCDILIHGSKWSTGCLAKGNVTI